MVIEQKNIMIATTAAIVFLTTTFGIYIMRRRRRSSKTKIVKDISETDGSVVQQKIVRVQDMKPPTNWNEIGKISSLHIYPMKSGRGMNLTKAEATKFGLEEICRKGRLPLRDRVFVIYREQDRKFISSKTYAKLLKLTVNSLNNDSVELSLDKDKIIVKLPDNKDISIIDMRTENIATVDCGNAVAAWISKLILDKDRGLRVGYWPGDPARDISQVFSDYIKIYNNMCNDFMGTYSDMSSYLIINQSSVDDLNVKINDNGNRITSDNFRPNIVVEGAASYSEDQWTWIKIGDDAIFKTFKPCTRCSVTTINPETLEKSKTNEPLKTLKLYRQLTDVEQRKLDGESPVMGMYMGLHTRGRIKYGDSVYIGI